MDDGSQQGPALPSMKVIRGRHLRYADKHRLPVDGCPAAPISEHKCPVLQERAIVRRVPLKMSVLFSFFAGKGCPLLDGHIAHGFGGTHRGHHGEKRRLLPRRHPLLDGKSRCMKRAGAATGSAPSRIEPDQAGEGLLAVSADPCLRSSHCVRILRGHAVPCGCHGAVSSCSEPPRVLPPLSALLDGLREHSADVALSESRAEA